VSRPSRGTILIVEDDPAVLEMLQLLFDDEGHRTGSLAQEVAPERIRINAIAPGAIRTPINRAAWETEDAYNRLLTLIPYRRIGEPEDIGRAAVWLASDASDYVVGTTLFVDGGMTLYPGFGTNG
jgi:glucose 1-dehydrogenase